MEQCSTDEFRTMLAVGEQKMDDNRKLTIWIATCVTAAALIMAAALWRQTTQLEANKVADESRVREFHAHEVRMQQARNESTTAYNSLVEVINSLSNKVHYDDGVNDANSQGRMNRHEELYDHTRNGG